MLNIKVLGSGCPNCKRLEAETRAALDSAGIAYNLSKVTEYDDIVAYGVMSTPALVVNEKMVSSGRKKTATYVGLVAVFSTVAGYLFGMFLAAV